MLELEEARSRILGRVEPLEAEKVLLIQATGRVAAEEVASSIDLPLFDNSAMDGYAVRAADLAGVEPGKPVILKVQGRVAAGDDPAEELKEGHCIQVFTGSPLPRGTNAVAMQENTEAPAPGQAAFLAEVKPWENVRLQGEDVKKGTLLVEQGQWLTTGRIALLAATGLDEVQVGRRPRVGLLATGSELREAGQAIGSGQIYESNRAALAALISGAGGFPKLYPLVQDTVEEIGGAMEQALNECDVLVTSGGVSVGEFDLVKNAFSELGGQLDFWKVAIKPGKPFVFGRLKEKLLFGLPGNPVSAIVSFLLLARPALARLQGASDVDQAHLPGVLAEPLVNSGDRRHFLRVSMDAGGRVRSAGTQASHMLSSLAKANGLVEVAPRSRMDVGETVRVLMIG